jgi:hypothetical protein
MVGKFTILVQPHHVLIMGDLRAAGNTCALKQIHMEKDSATFVHHVVVSWVSNISKGKNASLTTVLEQPNGASSSHF